MKTEALTSLEQKLLVATPMMKDKRFENALIYILEHDKNGATGIVINKKLRRVPLIDLFDKKENTDDLNLDNKNIDIYFGGPMDKERGFFLHSNDVSFKDSVYKTQILQVTATQDILKRVAKDEGPKNIIFALGYAGWEAGQLDQELCSDTWLVCDVDEKLLFETKSEEQWQAALNKMGIDLLNFSKRQGLA